MRLRNFFIFSMFLGTIHSAAYADGRPWGVIMPFGGTAVDQRGFQGRYNPWGSDISAEQNETPSDDQKQVRQRWQNIYRARPFNETEVWADSDKSSRKRSAKSQKRVFGDNQSIDEEQWPKRHSAPAPYRSVDRFWTPFGGFAPNMQPSPFVPYGGYNPAWRR